MNYAIQSLSNRPHRAKRRERTLKQKLSLCNTQSFLAKKKHKITTYILKNEDGHKMKGRRRKKAKVDENDKRKGINWILNDRIVQNRKILNRKVFNRIVNDRESHDRIIYRHYSKTKTDWWWVFVRFSTIFLFLIQLVKPIESLIEQHSTRNLIGSKIRFSIDHHSTYSTHFNDLLYTTPLYSRSFETINPYTTNLMNSQSTRQASQSSRITLGHYKNSKKEIITNDESSKASVRSTRDKLENERTDLEINSNLIQKKQADNELMNGDQINEENFYEREDHDDIKNRQTTITSSILPSFRSSTKTLARKIIEKSKFLTTKKQIKFDKQNPWLSKSSKYHQIHKNDLDDFEYTRQPIITTSNRRNSIAKNLANISFVTKKLDEEKSEFDLSPLLEKTMVPSNVSSKNVNSLKIENNFDELKTTKVFIPFSSTINDHFDYSFSNYDNLINKFHTLNSSASNYPLTTYRTTQRTNFFKITKLPRMKKNIRDEQIPPVRFLNQINNQTSNTAYLQNNPRDSFLNSDQMISQLINKQINRTQFINSTRSIDNANKFIDNDLNKLIENSTDNDELKNFDGTIDSLFLQWLGQYIAHPSFEKVIVTIAQLICLIFTIVGNVLVIISIFTYNPLRNVQNMFLVSLAISDITVAVCILPLNICYYLIEKWVFGIHLCKFWLTSDVLCCTASILNLCAIAVDRYQAIHDPINYRMKRTTKRVLLTIVFVWVLSAVTSIPPLFGWNDWPEEFTPEVPCRLTSEKGYVVFSSSVSFYIPLIIMTTVYIKIYKSAKKRLRKRAQSTGTGRASLKRGTKKGALDLKQYPSQQKQQFFVDGKLVEVNDKQAAILQNYLDKGIISTENENKLLVQLAQQANQPNLLFDNRIATDVGSFQAQQSSSTSHLQSNLKSDSGTGSSSTAAVIRVTNLLGAIKGSKNINEQHRQRQYSVTEPNTSSSNDEVVFADYTTGNENDGQHSLCLMNKQLNTIEFDPASLPIANSYKKDKYGDSKSSNRKIKRQSTPEEASDSSESLVDKDGEFSSNNGPQFEYTSQSQQPAVTSSVVSNIQQQSTSQQSIAKSFKNRFQHSIFHQSNASSSTPPTTLSVHYSSSQTSFSNSSSAFNQQPIQHTKFSSFNLLRRYRSRFHRANNATCFSNFEASSHSRPSIGVVSATSTPEVTSPSGNHSPKAGDQLPDVKEEPCTGSLMEINRNYLSATFKSTTCSALSKLTSDKSKQLTSSLNTLNITPTTLHRAKSDNCSNNFGLLHAVSQRLLQEQQNLIDEEDPRSLDSKQRRKSLGQLRLSICSDEQTNLTDTADSTTTNDNKMRSSNSCLNVNQSRSNLHQDSTTSNSNQKTSEITQKTSSGQQGTTSSSGPSSNFAIQPEKTSQNSNISSHSNNSNAISECNQRCLSPTTLLQLPNRRHHYSADQKNSNQTMVNLGSSESNKQTTINNSQRNHSSNSNYYSASTYSTTSTSVLTTSQIQFGQGSSGTTDQSANAIGSASSFNQSIRHSSNAYSSHSMVKQVWDQKQRISLSKERKAAQVLAIVMIAFVVSWLPFFLVYTFSPFCPFIFGEACTLSEFTQMVITWLGYINSAANPIIYTVFNMDFRIAFKRILMKCCCTIRWNKEQKIYHQQQQIRLNKRKEHKKKKFLHQQQKQKLKEQKAIDGEKDSFNDTSRKASFKDERKSSLKQTTKCNSINRTDELKKVRLEDDQNRMIKKEPNVEKETNLKTLARSLTGIDKISEIRSKPIKSIISYSCDNLKKKDQNKGPTSLTGRFALKANASLKKSKSEITSITLSYERGGLNDAQNCRTNLDKSSNQLIKLDNNNNEQADKDSTLTEIIIKTNLKQLERKHPDYCYFKI